VTDDERVQNPEPSDTSGTSAPPLRDMTPHLPYGKMPLLERIGIYFDSAAEGVCEGTWKPRNEACNPNGGVQGGLFNVVFDAAMSMAIHSALPPSDSCTSLEIRAATPGGGRAGDEFRVVGKVLRLGGTAIFAEAWAYKDGVVAATGSGTFLRRRKPPREQRRQD
jgi:acyl-coenzyme A thioesterase PaaI-like protein